jgi:hypothetical protein
VRAFFSFPGLRFAGEQFGRRAVFSIFFPFHFASFLFFFLFTFFYFLPVFLVLLLFTLAKK